MRSDVKDEPTNRWTADRDFAALHPGASAPALFELLQKQINFPMLEVIS